MSPRLSRQERIQQDLDELLSQSAMLAKALLVRNGEFFPFGATIGKRGKFNLVTPTPEGDRPTSQDVITAVLNDFGSDRDALRATSITALATTESGAEAVRVELEHADGPSIVIALPYSRKPNGSFEYGEMEAHHTGRRVWLDDPKPRKKAPARAPAKSTAKRGGRTTRQAASSTKTSKTAKTTRSTKREAGDTAPHRATTTRTHAEPVRVG